MERLFLQQVYNLSLIKCLSLHPDNDLSVICDCIISWSYSLALLHPSKLSSGTGGLHFGFNRLLCSDVVCWSSS